MLRPSQLDRALAHQELCERAAWKASNGDSVLGSKKEVLSPNEGCQIVTKSVPRMTILKKKHAK